MRHGNKADLMKCLEPLAPQPLISQEVDAKIFDGAALVHILEPKNKDSVVVKTFKDYTDIVFLPYLIKELQVAKRVDVVWDSYYVNSLKAHTRQCRGTGNPLHISEKTRIPKNWRSFLRVDSNKTELFQFHASAIQSYITPVGNYSSQPKGKVSHQPILWMCLVCNPAHKKKLTIALCYIVLMPTDMV